MASIDAMMGNRINATRRSANGTTARLEDVAAQSVSDPSVYATSHLSLVPLFVKHARKEMVIGVRTSGCFRQCSPRWLQLL